MPTIVFASSKGGAGKSTSAVLLATQLAERGAEVTLIDADPNRHVAIWASKPERPPNIRVVADVTEQTVIRQIDEAARQKAFVIVDLEGTASRMVVYAMSRADLVVIPTQASLLDALEAAAAVREVKRQEEAFRRPIRAAILLTRTSAAIRTRMLQGIAEEMREAGVEIFSTQLHDREAYRQLFALGGTVRSLDPKQVRNIDAAAQNGDAFAAEVIAMLQPAEVLAE
jgi:chromosome partitioning protein